MKIIDLLNKIANGEEVPKHIHIRDIDSYTWQEDIKAYWSDRDENNLLYDLDLSSTDLNEDIEILEEEKKIPEKLDTLTYTNRNTISIWNEHRDKINEIIDYLKSKGDE
jgi:hypothetical protein